MKEIKINFSRFLINTPRGAGDKCTHFYRLWRFVKVIVFSAVPNITLLLLRSSVGKAIFLIILLPQTAHAYLDPGTGSYLFQILIAVLLGGIYAVKIFWKKIVQFVKRFFKR